MLKVAQIIPCKKLPRTMSFFDYYVPPALAGAIKQGYLVDVPFKNQRIVGLVHSLKEDTEFVGAKEILGINESLCAGASYLLDFIKWFSSYYYYSFGSTLKLLLPEVPKNKLSLKDRPVSSTFISLKEDAKVKKLAEQIYCSTSRKKFLLFPFNQEQKDKFFLNLLRQAVKNKEQIAFLFPQIYKIHEFYQFLPKELREQTVILSAETYTAKTRHFQVWNQIAGNEKQIIIGTRSAIFAPFSRLKFIIIDEAHSEDYKQWDQNPRYETVNTAQKIQELFDCGLILSSLSPRIEDAWRAKQEKYSMISLGKDQSESIAVVDLKEERKKEFTYLSDELLREVGTAINSNKKSLLIVNKKGEYSYLFCADCRFEAVCPDCKLPLTVENNRLVCHRCGLKQEMILICPGCHGSNLKMLGVGLQQIKEKLSKIFAVKAAELGDGDSTTAKILLTTGQGIKKANLKDVGFLGFVYIDSLVYLSDFNSNFRLYSFIKGLSDLLPERTKMLVQTCFPENNAFASLNLGYEHFYKQELADRKSFDYPPFRILLKLFFDHHDKRVASEEAMNLYHKLRPTIEQKNGQITEPYLHYAQKVRKRYRQQVAVFLPELNLDEENSLLSQVPEYWNIDKTPINLL